LWLAQNAIKLLFFSHLVNARNFLSTAREVHVWSAGLDWLASRRDFRPLLSPSERDRADRFRLPRDCRRFTVCRGLLRTILSGLLGVTPAELSFAEGSHGKPYLPECDLRFNVSHSRDQALIAVTSSRELGVDIEFVNPEVATGEIADRFFSAGEKQAILQAGPDARARSFFAVWTRKEAYLKARGDGLSIPLDQFEVTAAPGVPAHLLRAPEGMEEARRWKIEDLEAEPGYAAAIAVEGHDWQLRLHRAED
jgi:4'-phosphopantetheinyl transferase